MKKNGKKFEYKIRYQFPFVLSNLFVQLLVTGVLFLSISLNAQTSLELQAPVNNQSGYTLSSGDENQEGISSSSASGIPLRGNSSTLPVLSEAEGLRGSGMNFTQNRGQVVDMKYQERPDVLFKSENKGTDIYIRKTGISYVLNNMAAVLRRIHEENEHNGGQHLPLKQDKLKEIISKQTYNLHRIDIEFVNCNPYPEIFTSDRLEGVNNYYPENVPEGILNVNSYNGVTVKNIYNNIDIKYYGGKENGLKYDIVVNPGGDPGSIKMKYSGAEEIEIRNGELRIKNSIGEIVEQLPKVYQNIKGKIIDVKTEYKIEHLVNNDVIIHFSFSSQGLGINSSYPLVIDPWVTYYGGSDADFYHGSICTDKTGNVIFTGWTRSVDFPVSPGAYQTTIGGLSSGFIVKMTSSGQRIFSTYYSYFSPGGVATDASNNIVTCGRDKLAKFNPAGGLIWQMATGGVNTQLTDVCCDAASNIYASGRSGSGFPVLAAYQSGFAGVFDCIAAKFNSAGVKQWASYYGGSDYEEAMGIACDNFGHVSFVGFSRSTNYPVLSAYQSTFGGGTMDAIVTSLNTSNGFPVWSTYYGGTSGDNDAGDAPGTIATDNVGNVLITGSTASTNNIATAGAYRTTRPATGAGGQDHSGYVAKFNASGVIQWATYIGGSSNMEPSGIASDINNNVVVAGDTYCLDMPVTSCAYQKVFKGTEDQFIMTFTSGGSLLCSGYIGIGDQSTPNNETMGGPGCIAVDGCFVYLRAATYCAYPVTTDAYQYVCGGDMDIALAKLYVNSCGGTTSNLSINSSPSSCTGQSNNFTSIYSNTCDGSSKSYLWSFSGGNPSTSTAQNPTGIIYNTSGVYNVKLVVQMPCGKDSVEKTIVINPCTITASATGTNICANTCTNVIAGGSGGTSPYTYSWNTGATTQSINVCPPTNTTTTYTVLVTDASGKYAISTASVTVSPKLILDTASRNVVCGFQSSALVNVYSGVPSYTYSWSSGQTTNKITDIPAGGYTVSVTDGTGACINTAVFNIKSSTTVSATFTSSPACVGTPVNFINTGTPPGSGITYNWEVSPLTPANVSGQTTDFSYTFLTAGTYSVKHTVYSGSCNVSVVNIITVVNCTGPKITATGSSVCPGSCATVTSSGSGGSGTYTYSWSNGATTQNIAPCPVSATTYTVTVKDAGGNTSTSTAVVTINPDIVVTASATNITCNGSANGSVLATVTGGSPSFTYNWSSGATTSQISNLTPQIYAVTVTDSKGCVATTTAAIISPPVLSGQYAKGTASCTGCGCKEWIMLNATGGTSPYSYTWPDGYTNRYKNRLCPNAYLVNIKDKNGCSVNVNLTAP